MALDDPLLRQKAIEELARYKRIGVGGASRILCVTPPTVRSRIETGKMRGIKYGCHYMIPAEEILKQLPLPLKLQVIAQMNKLGGETHDDD